MAFYNSPAFWAFLTAMIGAIRWLLRVSFHYRRRADSEKSKLDLSVESLKADTSLRTIEGLSKVVIDLIPRIKRLEDLSVGLEKSTLGVGAIEKNMTAMMKSLTEQYEHFTRVVPKVTASMQQVLDDVASIKTEIIQLKKGSPNVFVTQAKK